MALTPTTAAIGYGTKFYVEDQNSPNAYSELSKVIGVTPPNFSIDDVEVTHYQSPSRTREYIPGLTELGEMSVEMLFEAGSDTDDFIEAWRAAGDTRSCKIEWPSGMVWIFEGYPKGYEPQAPIDDKQTATLTVKVASSITRS